jgi:hypothetical protein
MRLWPEKLRMFCSTDIPIEIACLICSFLDVNSCYRLQLLNKSWQQLILTNDSVWKTLFVKGKHYKNIVLDKSLIKPLQTFLPYFRYWKEWDADVSSFGLRYPNPQTAANTQAGFISALSRIIIVGGTYSARLKLKTNNKPIYFGVTAPPRKDELPVIHQSDISSGWLCGCASTEEKNKNLRYFDNTIQENDVVELDIDLNSRELTAKLLDKPLTSQSISLHQKSGVRICVVFSSPDQSAKLVW